MLRHSRAILILCIAVTLCSSLSATQHRYLSVRPGLPIAEGIPEASLTCTPEEAKWWNSLREEGKRCLTRDGFDWGGIRKKRKKFVAILQQGISKSYHPPIPDTLHPVFLARPRPKYTEEARWKKILGIVLVRAEFRSDGTIGNLQVLRGLGYGLDENAIEAVSMMIFLPAVQNGQFVSKYLTAELTYKLL